MCAYLEQEHHFGTEQIWNISFCPDDVLRECFARSFCVKMEPQTMNVFGKKTEVL